MVNFDISNPDTYPQELKRLWSASARFYNAAQSAFDAYLKEPDYQKRDESLWRFYGRYYPMAFALGYRAAVIGANLKLDAAEYQSYINLMNQAAELYTRLLRSLDREYKKPQSFDFVYLGGKITESTAKARMTKAKREKNPQERPLSYKPFTIHLDNGKSDKGAAAIIGAYAYVYYGGIWLICEADSGKPLAKSGKGITKRGAHEYIRPLAEVMPQDSAALFTVDYWSDEPTKRFELCGFSLTDGNGLTEYERSWRKRS